jgi:hypothetical protein
MTSLRLKDSLRWVPVPAAAPNLTSKSLSILYLANWKFPSVTTQLLIDIHHYDKRLTVALSNLDYDRKVLECNRKKIKQFLEYIRAEGLSVPRQVRCVYVIRKISNLLGKEFYRTTKTDGVTVVS